MQNYVGQQIDRYRITERLGMGGMAVVYKAYDTRLERDVALKLIRTESIPQDQHERLFKRFEREAKAQARFKHPHIVAVHDYGEVDNSPYLVMDFISGGTLKDRLHGPVDWRQAVRWLIPVAEALDYAHQEGVIHRDIKPANILFDKKDQPILTDFGIAKVLETDEATLTGTGLGVGTPEYMAPEQWQGKTSAATDQYALGVVLYELITGRKPYSADTPAAIILMQATEPLAPPSNLVSGIPEPVEKVLYKALARDPQDRYENMDAFAMALRGLLIKAETLKPVKPAKATPTPDTRGAKSFDNVTRDALDITPVDAINVTSKGRRKLPKWALWASCFMVIIIIGSLIIMNSNLFDRDTQNKNTDLLNTTETYILTEAHIAGAVTEQVTPENISAQVTSSDNNFYDDFENPEFDGDFNHYIWRFWHPANKGITQENGYLKMQANVFTSIIPTQHTQAQITQSFFYESKIKLDTDSDFGSATIKLHIDLSNDNYWSTQCGLLVPDIAFCETTGSTDSQNSIWENLEIIDTDNWYTFRVEVDPIARMLYFFIDGESFGSAYIPVKEAGLYNFVIGIGPGSTADTTIAYFDDVNFGPIE